MNKELASSFLRILNNQYGAPSINYTDRKSIMHPSQIPTIDEMIAQAEWYADNDHYIMVVSAMEDKVIIGVADMDKNVLVDGAILEVR